MKVVFGCPIFNFQNTKVRENHELVRKQSKHAIAYIELIGSCVEHAKQIMYREFLKTNADYFFNVDADIAFLNCAEINPIDKLVELNEKLGKAIVGGIYVYKQPPALPAFRPRELQRIYEESNKFPENYKFEIPEKPFEVEWLAGGCMMIKREIIKKLMEKCQVPNLPMIHKKEYLSEDFAFCKRARELGYSIWAEPALKLGHQGTYFYTFADYKK